MAIILQAFDIRFKDLVLQIPYYKSLGFTHIQIAPVQKHCAHTWKWYRLYQPTGLIIGNSLGSKVQLQHLIDVLHRNGMKLIVDVVLNHTCGCPFCTNEGVITTLRWGTHRIIAHWKGYNNSERFNMLDWGPKQRENEQAHAIFLQELIDMGVDGFRFDAAKHITPAHFSKLRELVKNVNFDEFVWYGEVMDGNVEVCNEYVSIGMKVVDFPLVYNLMGALSLGKDIREVMKPSVWGYCAISVADCHDSVLGDSYHFSDAQDSILAISFILARNEGMPLVYHSKLADQHVKAALEYHARFASVPHSFDHSNCTPTRLWISRQDQGFCIINKKGEWDREDVRVEGVRWGKWRELVYGFEIEVWDGKIRRWGQGGEEGLNIGAREALFFVHEG